MSDQVTTVTRTSWLGNIVNSFVGALIGVLLFFGSFALLWFNEGRTNLADVARSSIAVDGATISAATDGKFVAVSGKLTSPEQVGDDQFLPPGPYIQVVRNAEMYAWTESSSSETTKEIGGSSTTKTTYTYERKWTSSPSDSSNFHSPSGHQNPEMRIRSGTFTVAQASVGAYPIDPKGMDLPGGTDLRLNNDSIKLSSGQRLEGNTIFDGRGTLSQPQVGDIRVTYQALPAGTTVTAFGKQTGGKLIPFGYSSSGQLYRAFTSDRDTAIATMNTEYRVMTWILRIVGFLMLWIGLGLVIEPVSTFLDVLPFLGNLSRTLTGALTFVIALVLWAVTVAVAIIAHSILAMIIVLGLMIGGVLLWSKMQRARTPAAV